MSKMMGENILMGVFLVYAIPEVVYLRIKVIFTLDEYYLNCRDARRIMNFKNGMEVFLKGTGKLT